MARKKDKKSRLFNIIRWLVSLLILTVLLRLFYIKAGQALCHIAIGQIEELTNTKINIGSVDFDSDGSVFIEDLVISPRFSQSSDSTILMADKVYASFSRRSLLSFDPLLQAIDINNFTFNAQYDLDTGWSNLSELKMNPPGNTYGNMPRIQLQNGTLQYSKIISGQPEVAASMPLNASFGPDEQSGDGYIFEITTATMSSGFGNSRLTGTWKPGIVTFAGGISSVDVPELEMAWMIDILAAELEYDPNNDYSLTLRIRDMLSKSSTSLDKLAAVGQPFLNESGLFGTLRHFFGRYQPRGLVDIDLDVQGNIKHFGECDISGQVDCKDVAFLYSGFQYPVENLTGRIDFTRNSVTLNNLRGRHGDVELSVNGWYKDFGPNRQNQIRIFSDKMSLDDDLYQALSEKKKDFWSSFSPVGHAALDLQLSRQPQQKTQINLELDLQNVNAVYKHFPYPMDNLTGKVYFDSNSVIFSQIESLVNGREITLNGEITTQNSDKPQYDISVDIQNIPMDLILESVLPDNQKELFRQFDPNGFIYGWVKVWTQDNGTISYTADLSFEETSIYLEELKLPIKDISAQVIFSPDLIRIKESEGIYGTSPVTLKGRFYPLREQNTYIYDLSLNFEQIRINEELLNLIPDSKKEIVTRLKSDGKVNLSVGLDKTEIDEPVDYRITMECLQNSMTLPDFPYPITDVNGILIIINDNVELHNVTAVLSEDDTPDLVGSEIKLNGLINMSGDVFSNAQLELQANDVFFSDELAQILHRDLRGLFTKLAPEGGLELDFEKIKILFGDENKKTIEFEGAIKLKSCTLNNTLGGVSIDSILVVKGIYNTDTGFSECRAVINDGTVIVNGKKLTGLKTEIVYDPNLNSWYTEDLIADCYGGKATGKFEIVQSAESTMENVLQFAFDNIDLEKFLSDSNTPESSENGYTSGKMSGSLNINSQILESSSRIGTCRLVITNMKVGKLSPLGQFLQVINLSEPKGYAFEQMYVDSYLKHDRVFIKKLDLSGQGIAFYGEGWMDLMNRAIDLRLTSRGRRLATDDPSVLQSLTEGLGQAVVRMEVGGTFDKPEVETKALPVIGETLQILGTRSGAEN
ncbi:AsmA-like C-terminal domain-containing protein [Planctomycetota bacterium]